MSSEAAADLQSFIGKPIKVRVTDGRIFVGELYCVDYKMSLLISNCNEFKQVKVSDLRDEYREELRPIGLALITKPHVDKIWLGSAEAL